jgi:hypothetical protein
MGSLKPRIPLIYERIDDVIYSREVGAAPDTRIEVGYRYDSRTSDGRPLVDHIRDSKLWGDIHRAASDNPTLQKALEQCIIIYYLSKEKKQPPDWHPV